MTSFGQVFGCAIKQINPIIVEYGFKLVTTNIVGGEGSQCIGGSAFFEEKKTVSNIFKSKQYINLSVYPFRLELDLGIGIGKDCCSIYELCDLEKKGSFPHRKHNLYDSAYNSELLADEFRLLINNLIINGQRFFNKDASLWNDLQNKRKNRCTLDEHRNLFKKAEVAFKAKDWNEVVELLDRNDLSLSKLNNARLKYAKRKSNESI